MNVGRAMTRAIQGKSDPRYHELGLAALLNRIIKRVWHK